MPELKPLSLDAIVRNVAGQLAALRTNPPPDPVIAFTGCEIELTVNATVEANGGIQFHIFSAGGKVAGGQTSRIKLSFGAAGTPLVMKTASDEAPAHVRQSGEEGGKKKPGG
jgi:hypothetical protein